MVVGKIAAIGLGGAASVAVVSAGVLLGTGSGKGQEIQREPSDNPGDQTRFLSSPTEASLKASKSTFDAKTVNGASNQPPLTIKKGACFDGFFPEVTFTRPAEEVGSKKLKDLVPNDWKLGDGGAPVKGCRIVKGSSTTGGTLFGYLSESVVSDGTRGMALYTAVTNIKTQNKQDSEQWILFLRKAGDKWQMTGSHRWSGNENAKAEGVLFGSMLPGNQDWRLNASASSDVTQFFNAAKENRTGFWKGQDMYFAGLWNAGGASDDQHAPELFFNPGAWETFVLYKGVNDTTGSLPQHSEFVTALKLTQTGTWTTAEKCCDGQFASITTTTS